jgi:hypothetical protein
MELEDYLQPQVAVTAALAAVVFSPRVRGVLRRGAVFGLAGALMAGDALAVFARGVTRGAQQAARAVPVPVEATGDGRHDDHARHGEEPEHGGQ